MPRSWWSKATAESILNDYLKDYISYKRPKQKAIAVKSKLKRPPTYERTESIFPRVLVTVKLFVDLKILK